MDYAGYEAVGGGVAGAPVFDDFDDDLDDYDTTDSADSATDSSEYVSINITSDQDETESSEGTSDAPTDETTIQEP